MKATIATNKYGIGFSPSACAILCTTGTAIAAAAVLLEISVSTVENSVKANTVSRPPVSGSSVIASAIFRAAPVSVTRSQAAGK